VKLTRSEPDKGSIVSDVLFAIVTSVVSGCLGGFALILLVLALTGDSF